jgi:antitoxin component YwqK of YwqJK toxin-antitoxin module
MKQRSSAWLIPAVLTLLNLLFLMPVQSSAARYSPALQRLHQHLVKTIPVDWSHGVDYARQTHPVVYAIGMGWLVQSQKKYADHNDGFDSMMSTVTLEITALLKQTVRDNDYKDPKSGKPMSEMDPVGAFYQARSGSLNQWARETMKFDPGSISLPPVIQAENDHKPNYKLPVREDDAPGRIVLGGEEAPPAKITQPHPPISVEPPKPDRTEGSGGVYVSELICPETGSGPHTIDTNGNKYDQTRVLCEYGKDGLLSIQYPFVNGVKHGVQMNFGRYKDQKQKQNIFLLKAYHYNMGKCPKTEQFSLTKNKKGIYLTAVYTYPQSGGVDAVYYYENGQKEGHTFQIKGKMKIQECWSENGAPKNCLD